MKKKKDTDMYLQHKLPWESEWEDVGAGKTIDCEKFMSILGEEPPHLIATEYRIIKKKLTQLRNKAKSIVCPVCIMSGSQIADRLKELKRSD